MRQPLKVPVRKTTHIMSYSIENVAEKERIGDEFLTQRGTVYFSSSANS
jgi:hypothetical protein